MSNLNDIIADINDKIRGITEMRESLFELYKNCDDSQKREHYMEALHLTHVAFEHLADAVDELKEC